jgi:hypothetical protein
MEHKQTIYYLKRNKPFHKTFVYECNGSFPSFLNPGISSVGNNTCEQKKTFYLYFLFFFFFLQIGLECYLTVTTLIWPKSDKHLSPVKPIDNNYARIRTYYKQGWSWVNWLYLYLLRGSRHWKNIEKPW